MLKLTDEQAKRLCDEFQTFLVGGRTEAIEAVIDCYHAMLNASPTHRVVEAPEGKLFRTPDAPDTFSDTFAVTYRFATVNIPKLCPAPVLEPVTRTDTITVTQVYGGIPEIPSSFEAVFGRVEELRAKGFTEVIGWLSGDYCSIAGFSGDAYRICLRKWEGK